MITEEIPAKVAADRAYQNAMLNSDKQNAKIENEKALKRVMTEVLNDDTQLFSKFHDDPTFRKWLTERVFEMTYENRAE
jgi:type I restriction enzyme R subunit